VETLFCVITASTETRYRAPSYYRLRVLFCFRRQLVVYNGLNHLTALFTNSSSLYPKRPKGSDRRWAKTAFNRLTTCHDVSGPD